MIYRQDLSPEEKRTVFVRSVHGVTQFEYGLNEHMATLISRIAAYFGERESTIMVMHQNSRSRVNPRNTVEKELDGDDEVEVLSGYGNPESIAPSLLHPEDNPADWKKPTRAGK